MNNRVNYTLIGFLVLVGITLVLGFTYWMLKPTENEDVKYYTIYFNESVLGLNVDAPVKYRGITVGKVEDLKINPKNSEQVEATVSVLKSTPIKVTTVAKLTSQGITGLSYINLSLGSQMSKNLECKKGEKYPVIKTAPSFFANLENSFNDVSSSLTSTLGRTEKLLGATNQEQIAQILQHTASVIGKLDDTLNKKTIAHLQQSVKNVDELTLKLNNLTPDIQRLLKITEDWQIETTASMNSITKSYLGLDTSIKGMKEALKDGETDFSQMSNDLIPTLNATLLDFQDLMVRVDEILEEYKTSPSDILFKSQEKIKGPGEK